MSENQDVAVNQDVADQDVNTTEAAQIKATTDETATEADSQAKDTQANEKTFNQDEVNDIVKKRIAKATAIAERKASKAYAEKLETLASQNQAQKQEINSTDEPKIEDFEKFQDYTKALIKWDRQTQQQSQERQTEEQKARKFQSEVQSKAQRAFELAEEDPEFDSEAFEALTELSEPMAYAIMDSDIAPKVMVYLTKNPEEVSRIAKLSPARQAAEIGKMEAKLSIVEKVKPSNAPAPIKPIGSRGGMVSGDPEKMSMEQYEAMRAKQGARWARR